MFAVQNCSTSVKEVVRVQGSVKNAWLLKLQNKISDKRIKSPVNAGFFYFQDAKAAKKRKGRKVF